MGQIVNISSNEAISEVSLKCGDSLFKDFPKNIYRQAIYRAERDIAKQYGILERMYEYTLESADVDDGIIIPNLNFNGEYWVRISKEEDDDGNPIWEEYKKINKEDLDYYFQDGLMKPKTTLTDQRVYYITYEANQYVLRYYNPEEGDLIRINYISGIAGEEDYIDDGENIIPVLPNIYFEETVRRAVVYIAHLGVARFDSIKAERYKRLLGLYSRKNQYDSNLEKDRAWIQIKPFRYL